MRWKRISKEKRKRKNKQHCGKILSTDYLTELNTHFFFLLLITMLFIITACSSSKVVINNYKVNVEVADSPQKYQKGLMFREPLKANEGMLFIFPDEILRSFWMKNVFFPIDIIFLNSEKKVVDLKDNFYPCTKEPCEIYTSKPAKYVIEIQRNFVENNNVKVGDAVVVDN